MKFLPVSRPAFAPQSFSGDMRMQAPFDPPVPSTFIKQIRSTAVRNPAVGNTVSTTVGKTVGDTVAIAKTTVNNAQHTAWAFWLAGYEG